VNVTIATYRKVRGDDFVTPAKAGVQETKTGFRRSPE